MARYLAPVALAILIAAVAVVVMSASGRSGRHSGPANQSHATHRKLPPYWIVRPGDTLTQISVKTGLTVAQLEAFNPQTDPNSLSPGQRLNLWRHPPIHVQPRRSPGPMFWTVRPGESFGSIAAKTGIDIVKLQELNPQLKPSTLQPGDQVRLRQ